MSFYEHHGHEQNQRPLPDGYGDLREAPAGGAADAPEPEAAAPAAVSQVHREGAPRPAARPFFREPRSPSPSPSRGGFAQGDFSRENRRHRRRSRSPSPSRGGFAQGNGSRENRGHRRPAAETPCRFFATAAGCRDGSRCRFSHRSSVTDADYSLL